MDAIEVQAYEKAVGVLRFNSTSRGFLASKIGYPDVWARDACIANLGAMLTGDKELIKTAGNSLDTLASCQTELGQIPNYVKFPTVKASFSAKDFAEAGSVDATLWYILAVYYYFSVSGDGAFLKRHKSSVDRALLWLRCQDIANCGLIEVAEAGDWTDLFSNRYNILYDECLYYGVLMARARIAKELGEDRKQYLELASSVKKKVNFLFWVDRKNDSKIEKTNPKWLNIHRRIVSELDSAPYYLPYVAFMEFGYRCDVYANILAILFGLSDNNRSRMIMEHLERVGADTPYPIRVLYPPVFEGERDWRDYFRYKELNLPYQHQNGAIWPYVGGFWVSTLAHLNKKHAKVQLTKLGECNRLGVRRKWEFNEWLHGLSGQPMGRPLQTWSAGMYIYSFHALEKKHALVLGDISK